MRSIELFRLRRVRDKPRALAVIAAYAHLEPPQALSILHAALAGERPCLALADDATACACIEALAPTGFVARYASTADFDLTRHAHAALTAALPSLPLTVSDAVGALLLQGEPVLALDRALQHLRMHQPPHDEAHALLARTAIEVGLVAGAHARA